jgi:hypothetical protein
MELIAAVGASATQHGHIYVQPVDHWRAPQAVCLLVQTERQH